MYLEETFGNRFLVSVFFRIKIDEKMGQQQVEQPISSKEKTPYEEKTAAIDTRVS